MIRPVSEGFSEKAQEFIIARTRFEQELSWTYIHHLKLILLLYFWFYILFRLIEYVFGPWPEAGYCLAYTLAQSGILMLIYKCGHEKLNTYNNQRKSKGDIQIERLLSSQRRLPSTGEVWIAMSLLRIKNSVGKSPSPKMRGEL